mgnify:FL=1
MATARLHMINQNFNSLLRSMSACANCAPIRMRTHRNAPQASTRYMRVLKAPSLRILCAMHRKHFIK